MRVIVTPDPRYTAEVVVLVTSLGAKRTEYNAGKRIRDFFEIKRVHYKPIDFNRDARMAGTGEAENKAIQTLMNANKLMTSESEELVLPQIFVDGHLLGGVDDIQCMEDEGELNPILLRQRDWKIEEILPGIMTIGETLAELARIAMDQEQSSSEYETDEDD